MQLEFQIFNSEAAGDGTLVPDPTHARSLSWPWAQCPFVLGFCGQECWGERGGSGEAGAAAATQSPFVWMGLWKTEECWDYKLLISFLVLEKSAICHASFWACIAAVCCPSSFPVRWSSLAVVYFLFCVRECVEDDHVSQLLLLSSLFVKLRGILQDTEGPISPWTTWFCSAVSWLQESHPTSVLQFRDSVYLQLVVAATKCRSHPPRVHHLITLDLNIGFTRCCSPVLQWYRIRHITIDTEFKWLWYRQRSEKAR